MGQSRLRDVSPWTGRFLIVLILLVLPVSYALTRGLSRVNVPEVAVANATSVENPETPAALVSSLRRGSENTSGYKATENSFDVVERLDPESNEHVQNAYLAVTTGQDPEVTGPMLSAPPFDRSSYESDPQSYLAKTVPGRVFQSAQPAPEVDVVGQLSKTRHVLRKGESVRLQIRTEPGMPGNFMATDLGTFASGLSSTSVAADADGIAEAVFTASGGLSGETQVLASSPVTSGRVRFSVRVVE